MVVTPVIEKLVSTSFGVPYGVLYRLRVSWQCNLWLLP